MRRVRLVIRGLVQGVSYRANAAHEGRRLGVTGWVRNQPDGSVLLEAQGDADRIESLIDWCKQGPSLAEVERVETSDVPLERDERGFAIRH